MKNTESSKHALKYGNNIAVIGGGPSGSFFSYFALKRAKERGLEINIDIFESKDFNCLGATGCNHCGGLISESFIQTLSREGIDIPVEMLQKDFNSYTIHLDKRSVELELPTEEKRVAAVHRGMGPKACRFDGKNSIDEYMLDVCKSNGANIIQEKVIELERNNERIILRTNNSFEKEYDFVVGAIGINQKAIELFKNVCPAITAPKKTRAHICEIHLKENQIKEYFGNSIHIFLLNLPNIKFAKVIPKGTHMTLVIIGENINKDSVDSFLESETFKKCFPPNIELNKIISCRSYPFINIKNSKLNYADRLVLIGDASASRLYKDGIRTAYIAAEAAVNTVIDHGISEYHFKKYFTPTLNNLKHDNTFGKFIFSFLGVVQKTVLVKRAILRMLYKELEKPMKKRRVSAVFWDIYAGSVSYRSIFLRFFDLKILFSLGWNWGRAIFRKPKSNLS